MLNVKNTTKSSKTSLKYTNRNFSTKNAVKKISSISKSFNKNNKPNDELLKYVYLTLKEQKKEYKDFFNIEQNLEHKIKELFEQKKSHAEHYLKNLFELLDIYNNSIDALYNFDKLFETNYKDTILEIVNKYNEDFSKLSIFIEADGKLRFSKSKLKKIYLNSPNLFNFFCSTSNSFLLKVYIAFSSIKKIMPEDLNFNKSEHGLLIDEKC